MRRAIVGFALCVCAVAATAQEDAGRTRLGVALGGVAWRSGGASGGEVPVELTLLQGLSTHWDLDLGVGSVRGIRERWPHSTVEYDFTSVRLGVRLWSEEDRRARLYLRLAAAWVRTTMRERTCCVWGCTGCSTETASDADLGVVVGTGLGIRPGRGKLTLTTGLDVLKPGGEYVPSVLTASVGLFARL